ncbi:hypothetical protein Cgig2_014749 [Carnegiea gigantea]|uniref:Reverse transcriptase zinc-binding domain-containing protein n=1 Tax=Carnegiea gigantea TaxID=171969 RepID=A0A9Q1QTH9_9CARY|nr:hypothetical protein Cgig2_014749 [Carnegiea gigantea]
MSKLRVRRQIFLPCDTELILDIPLCMSWPMDKLIWHYNARGLFTVRSAYHMIVSERASNEGSPSTHNAKLWRALWECNIPPRIKLFGWRACVGSLPSSHRILTRVPGFAMSCSVCDHAEDTPTHAVLECPLAIEVWSGSGLDESLWASKYRTFMDCIVQAMQLLSEDSFGDFLAIMWECWNARNRFIFGTPESNLSILGKRALSFVRSYRLHHEATALTHGTVHPFAWTPPPPGYVKLNFDGDIISETIARWGFVIRDHNDNILLAGTKHQPGHADASIEEARACLHGLTCAHNHGVRNIIIEGDCLHLIELLKAKSTPDNFLGFLVKDITFFLTRFDLYAWSFVKRGGNRVAHDLAH